MMIVEASAATRDTRFSGVVEVDETFQRESRKGSGEWANRAANSNRHPAPATAAVVCISQQTNQDGARPLEVADPVADSG
ncbi:hypothetical protein GCM10011363_34260 [Marivita lacus]|uniref:Transposase n=1 Tax=Marivita lacus TaxID=1323742 RepID=A0ABQ1L0T4_9RHOB|nr:hypothetical protein GCM10011363_34260 [Marivita lacus]